MAKLKGAFIAAKFEEITSFDWTDQKTGVVKPIRNVVVLLDNGDGTIDRVQIGFPRDPAYRPPQLEPQQQYMFPVVLSINKKRQEVSYTMRTDMPPTEAPDIA